jgi:hypothetical protein
VTSGMRRGCRDARLFVVVSDAKRGCKDVLENADGLLTKHLGGCAGFSQNTRLRMAACLGVVGCSPAPVLHRGEEVVAGEVVVKRREGDEAFFEFGEIGGFIAGW